MENQKRSQQQLTKVTVNVNPQDYERIGEIASRNGLSAARVIRLAKEHGYELDFSKVECELWVEACIDSINSGQEALKRPQFE